MCAGIVDKFRDYQIGIVKKTLFALPFKESISRRAHVRLLLGGQGQVRIVQGRGG
jgi:hypothetical protein